MHDLLRHLRRDALLETVADGQLLERFVEGQEEAAFAALVRRHGPMVWGVCLRVLTNVHDAEDCFQASFLVLARKAAAVRPRDLVGHWLYGVAYHTALKALAQKHRRRQKECERVAPAAEPTDPLQELLPHLDDAVSRLPEKYRVPVVLCELQGRPRKEVARVLKLPEGTISSRLATARKLLARHLNRRGLTASALTLSALPQESSAALPATVTHSAIKAGMLAATGAHLNGIVSAPVLALAEGVLKAMFLRKLSTTLVLVLLTVLGGAVWLLRPSVAAEPPKPQSAEATLREGWKKSFSIPEPSFGPGDRYVVWVEKGWLQVKRETKEGVTDWHIILAKATDPKPPTIAAEPGTITFDVSYRGGRYFIRDTADILRSVRERKRGVDGTWPKGNAAHGGPGGSAGGEGQPPVVVGWTEGDWFMIAGGPTQENYDYVLRLDATTAAGSGFGFQGFRGDLRRVTHGEMMLIDDGESLTVTRGLEAVIREKREREDRRAKLIGAAAPALEGKWHDGNALSWKDLEGKVVLLDFWGTWCGACVQKLPETEAVFEKYRGRGLVVIGVHSPNGAEDLPEFLKKHAVSFPILVADAKLVEGFGVDGYPAYFLVDKTGKVVGKASHKPPKDEDIEALLKR